MTREETADEKRPTQRGVGLVLSVLALYMGTVQTDMVLPFLTSQISMAACVTSPFLSKVIGPETP